MIASFQGQILPQYVKSAMKFYKNLSALVRDGFLQSTKITCANKVCLKEHISWAEKCIDSSLLIFEAAVAVNLRSLSFSEEDLLELFTLIFHTAVVAVSLRFLSFSEKYLLELFSLLFYTAVVAVTLLSLFFADEYLLELFASCSS